MHFRVQKMGKLQSCLLLFLLLIYVMTYCRCKLELGTNRTATPDEIFDLDAKAKTAGCRLTKEYLKPKREAV